MVMYLVFALWIPFVGALSVKSDPDVNLVCDLEGRATARVPQ
jgi:hypothetical protein